MWSVDCSRRFMESKKLRKTKKIKKQRFGFDSTNEVSTTRFPDLINKSVEHLFQKRGSKQPNFVYLDDQKVADFKKQGVEIPSEVANFLK